jgi:hypothetical protein
MDNSETLTTLGTQETGRTMTDITLHRKKVRYNIRFVRLYSRLLYS